MANRFTSIPEGNPPQLPEWTRPVIWLGDLTMWLMFSRPATGSLSNTWVTPATLILAIWVGLVCLAFSALTIVNPDSWLRIIFALALFAVATGSLAVSTIGVEQRLSQRRRNSGLGN